MADGTKVVYSWCPGLPVRVRRKNGGQVGAIIDLKLRENTYPIATIHWGNTYGQAQTSREELTDSFELVEAGQLG